MLSFSSKAKGSSPLISSKIGKPSAKRCRGSLRVLVSAERLAAAVERTAEHADAERALADLRKRRNVVRAKLAETAHTIGTSATEQRLYREERDLERQISTAAHALAPFRQKYGRRVEQELRPETQAAATAALAAIAEAEAAIGRLNELRASLRLVGRPTPTLSPKPLLIVRLQIEDAVRRGEAA